MLINVMDLIKESTCIPHKCKPFWQLIELLPYVAVSRNADLFVHEKLTKLLPRTIKWTLRKENFMKKKTKNLLEDFLQLFVETSLNKHPPFLVKTINNFLT